MVSDEGESFSYHTPTKPEGPVEVWMTKVDEEMKSTLLRIMKEGVYKYAQMERSAERLGPELHSAFQSCLA